MSDVPPPKTLLGALFVTGIPLLMGGAGGTARAHGLTLVTKDERMQSSPLLRTIW